MGFFWSKISRKRFIRPLAVITFLVCAAYYYVMVYVGLPSDEEMIAHLNAHKSEIEELIRRYQNFKIPMRPKSGDAPVDEEGKQLMPSAYGWEKQQSDTEDIMKKAGISEIMAGGRLWLPDPYSPESIKKAKELGNNLEEYRLYKNNSRALSIGYSPENRYARVNIYYGRVFKGIKYFPQTPRIENGCLIRPGSKWSTVCDQVLTTLDRLPSHWGVFECVYRQIEPQWFLTLCNGR